MFVDPVPESRCRGPWAPCCKRCFCFSQGCWLHRAFQRDGLHPQRAVQHALGPFPFASEAPTLDRSPRGGRGLLQPGLQAARPSTHRQLRRAQVRVTGVLCRDAVISPLELWTSVFMDSAPEGPCEQSGYLWPSCFSVAQIDLLKVASPRVTQSRREAFSSCAVLKLLFKNLKRDSDIYF